MRAFSVIAAPFPRWRAYSVSVSTLTVAISALTILALALRLTWVFYTDSIPLGGDPHWYFVVASNIANGYGFVVQPHPTLGETFGPGEPTAFWPPGYPLLLAGLYQFTGVSITAPQVLNAILGALTVPFVFALGKAIFDQRAGTLAAGLFAVFPNVIAGVPLLFPEPVFTLTFVAALWLLTVSSVNRRWLIAVSFGILVGFACLTRGQGLVLVPVAAFFWLARDGWRVAAQSTAVALIAAILVIAPWTVRNAAQLHAFVPISTNSGAALRVGHGPESIGTTKWTKDEIDGRTMRHAMNHPETEVEAYREYTRLAIDYAFTHPIRELELAKLKLWNLYRSDAEILPWITTLGATPLQPDGLEDALWTLFDVTYYVLFFAAVASIPLWIRKRPEIVLLVGVFLFWTLFHVAFLAEPRYHVPLYPFFMIAVAGGLWIAFDAGRKRLNPARPSRKIGSHD